MCVFNLLLLLLFSNYKTDSKTRVLLIYYSIQSETKIISFECVYSQTVHRTYSALDVLHRFDYFTQLKLTAQTSDKYESTSANETQNTSKRIGSIKKCSLKREKKKTETEKIMANNLKAINSNRYGPRNATHP